MQRDSFFQQNLSVEKNQLKFYILGLMSSFKFKPDHNNANIIKEVYFEFLKNTSKVKEVRELLRSIHYEIEMTIIRTYPELQTSEISVLGKEELKRLIYRYIQKQLSTQDLADDSSELMKPEQVNRNPEPIFITIDDSVQAKIEENVSPSKDIIDQLSNLQIHFNTQEIHQINDEDEVFQGSQQYGHFLYGDKPLQIMEIKGEQQRLYAKIKWSEREDGFCPQDSELLVDEVRSFVPVMMIEALSQYLNQNETKSECIFQQKQQEVYQKYENIYNSEKKWKKSKKIVKKDYQKPQIQSIQPYL